MTRRKVGRLPPEPGVAMPRIMPDTERPEHTHMPRPECLIAPHLCARGVDCRSATQVHLDGRKPEGIGTCTEHRQPPHGCGKDHRPGQRDEYIPEERKGWFALRAALRADGSLRQLFIAQRRRRILAMAPVLLPHWSNEVANTLSLFTSKSIRNEPDRHRFHDRVLGDEREQREPGSELAGPTHTSR